VLMYIQVKLSLQRELLKTSHLGERHTQSILNFHFTLGNQLLVSRVFEEKSHLY